MYAKETATENQEYHKYDFIIDTMEKFCTEYLDDSLFIKDVEDASGIKLSQSKYEELEKDGITYPDLSNDISYETAIKLSQKLARKYMSRKDKEDLKSICYRPRIVSKTQHESQQGI